MGNLASSVAALVIVPVLGLAAPRAGAAPVSPTEVAEGVPPCDTCPEDGWPLRLAQGPFRTALLSPDGSLLAVYGGPGEAAREHTVVVLERRCPDGALVSRVVLSRSAPFVPEDPRVPAPLVRLAWSKDGRWLFAAGGVYRLGRDGEGRLTARRTRSVPGKFLDFRFGPGGKAVAVEMVDARRRQIRTGGQKGYAAHLAYMMVLPTRDTNLAIEPRDPRGAFWAVEEQGGPPAVQWEADGSILLRYPYLDTVERFLPGRRRDQVNDVRPEPRPKAGSGPFTVEGDCTTTWRLVSDDKAVRVFVSVE